MERLFSRGYSTTLVQSTQNDLAGFMVAQGTAGTCRHFVRYVCCVLDDLEAGRQARDQAGHRENSSVRGCCLVAWR